MRWIAVYGVILVLAVSVMVPITSFATARSSSAGFASEAIFSGGGVHWEPAIAADPTPGSSYVYQAVTDLNGSGNPGTCPGCNSAALNSARILVRSSSDGGATWNSLQPICACNGQGWQFDPQLQVATDGTVYAAFLQRYDPGAVLYKSTDHGQTWTGPVRITPGLHYSDKPLLLISPTGKDVYVAFWGKGDSFVTVSHDFGQNFASPIKVTNVPTAWAGAWSGTVTPSGSIYYAELWEPLGAPQELVLVGSTNMGSTWTATVLATSLTPPPCGVAHCHYAVFAAHDAIASDSKGNLLFVYTANSADEAAESLYERTSSDGVTWTAPVVVNDQGDSYAPQVAGGPTKGDFRLAWQDNRNAACTICGGIGGWNTWYEQTTDGGASWSSTVQLSNLGSGAPYKSPSGYLWPDGDYFGLTASPQGTSYAIWGESDGSSLFCCGSAWSTQSSVSG